MQGGLAAIALSFESPPCASPMCVMEKAEPYAHNKCGIRCCFGFDR